MLFKQSIDDDFVMYDGGHAHNDEECIVKEFKRDARKCTDVPMLIVFLLFTGSMGYFAALGKREGQLDMLIAPLDGDSRFCG